MEPVVRVELAQQQDFRFEARFDDPALAPLVTDEPPPLGGGAGPNPVRLLTLAVANCLTASLLFAMRKFRNDPGALRTSAQASVARDAGGRWRVAGIAVQIHLGARAQAMPQRERALAQYEDFCIVTQSVRRGTPVEVQVFDADGVQLAPPPATAAPA